MKMDKRKLFKIGILMVMVLVVSSVVYSDLSKIYKIEAYDGPNAQPLYVRFDTRSNKWQFSANRIGWVENTGTIKTTVYGRNKEMPQFGEALNSLNNDPAPDNFRLGNVMMAMIINTDGNDRAESQGSTGDVKDDTTITVGGKVYGDIPWTNTNRLAASSELNELGRGRIKVDELYKEPTIDVPKATMELKGTSDTYTIKALDEWMDDAPPLYTRFNTQNKLWEFSSDGKTYHTEIASIPFGSDAKNMPTIVNNLNKLNDNPDLNNFQEGNVVMAKFINLDKKDRIRSERVPGAVRDDTTITVGGFTFGDVSDQSVWNWNVDNIVASSTGLMKRGSGQNTALQASSVIANPENPYLGQIKVGETNYIRAAEGMWWFERKDGETGVLTSTQLKVVLSEGQKAAISASGAAPEAAPADTSGTDESYREWLSENNAKDNPPSRVSYTSETGDSPYSPPFTDDYKKWMKDVKGTDETYITRREYYKDTGKLPFEEVKSQTVTARGGETVTWQDIDGSGTFEPEHDTWSAIDPDDMGRIVIEINYAGKTYSQPGMVDAFGFRKTTTTEAAKGLSFGRAKGEKSTESLKFTRPEVKAPIPGNVPSTAIPAKTKDNKDTSIPIPNEIIEALKGKFAGDASPENREISLKEGNKLTWNEDRSKWVIKDSEGKTVEEYRYSPKGRVHWDSGSSISDIMINGKDEKVHSSFAKSAKFDSKGNLIIDKLKIRTDSGDLKEGEARLSGGDTLTKKDGSKVVALDNGFMNVDKDGENIVIRIEGQTDQKLTKVQYKKLTGDKLSTSPDDLRKAAAKVADLGFVIEAIAREGLSLDTVNSNQKDLYWTGTVQVKVSGDGRTVTVVTSGEGFKADGELKDGENYEEVTKTIVPVEGGKPKAVVTKIVTKKDGKVDLDIKWELDGSSMTIGKTRLTRQIDSGPGRSGWTFYQDPNSNLFYNHEYGGWYTYDSKTGYSKASGDALKKIPEGLEDKIKNGNDKKDGVEGNPTRAARNVQRVFSTLETAASGGLGRFFSLFMEDEKLAKWREGVDDFLCSTIIGGGKECWTSNICSKWVENRPNGGITYTETPSGMIDIAVHVEAHKELIIYPGEGGEEAREYIYKLTYLVKNPEEHRLGFNVVFEGERTARLYSTNVMIEPNSQSSRLGASAMMQYSDYNYETICIEMSQEIISASAKKVGGKVIAKVKRMVAKKMAGSGKVSRVCNRINAREKIFAKKRGKPGLRQTEYAPAEEARELDI